jgi:hypothetical protein
MSDAPSIPHPSALWKQVSLEKRQQAAEAFWRGEHDPSELAEVVNLITQRLKFRTKSFVVLPVAKKSQYLINLPALPEMVAARLLVSYHMAHQRPLMGAFLDALGVAHKDGIIAEDAEVSPTADKTREAVKAIAASFPKDDVALYLSTLYWQGPDTWAVLPELPEAALAPRS